MPAPAAQAPMSGSIRMFKAFGINVYLHWSWLIIAVLELQFRRGHFESPAWNIAEYLTLFGIVLLHEFGHALACRSVGGQAEHIILWPLGGIAFVRPPQRPGAVLWSIAAGPLVNIVLVPITLGLVWWASGQGLAESNRDAFRFLVAIANINLLLLVFNLLPVYPLDGGQILFALLWFVIGRTKSLLIVSVIGLVVGVAAIGVAIVFMEIWMGILAAFIVMKAWSGFQQARLLAEMERAAGPNDPIDLSWRNDAGNNGPPIVATCGQCGARNIYPGTAIGTVQACRVCGATGRLG